MRIRPKWEKFIKWFCRADTQVRPYGGWGSWVEIDQHISTLFSSAYLKISSKFYVEVAGSGRAQHYSIIVGADLRVRPLQAIQICKKEKKMHNVSNTQTHTHPNAEWASLYPSLTMARCSRSRSAHVKVKANWCSVRRILSTMPVIVPTGATASRMDSP